MCFFLVSFDFVYYGLIKLINVLIKTLNHTLFKQYYTKIVIDPSAITERKEVPGRRGGGLAEPEGVRAVPGNLPAERQPGLRHPQLLGRLARNLQGELPANLELLGPFCQKAPQTKSLRRRPPVQKVHGVRRQFRRLLGNGHRAAAPLVQQVHAHRGGPQVREH